MSSLSPAAFPPAALPPSIVSDSADSSTGADSTHVISSPRPGFTLWLTGLSGAGKSTIASAVALKLRAHNIPVEILDGDEVREHLSKGLGFSREDRDTNIRRIGFVAKLLARNGVAVISAAISPFRDVRDEVRVSSHNFVEIYVNASLDECIRRDVKGLYKKALSGEIPQFTGVSDPYEPPLTPELVLETDHETVDDSVGRILDTLRERGYLSAVAATGSAS
jgi:adenylyl-sulfate kinase